MNVTGARDQAGIGPDHGDASAMTRIDLNVEDGLAAAAAGVSAGNYLGDPRVVDRLVRDFLAFAVSTSVGLQAGDIDADQAEVKLVDLSKRYGRIFMGEDPGYRAMPWNSPRRLGAYIQAIAVPHAEDHARPIDGLFAFFGTAAIQVAMCLERHDADESEAQEALDEFRTQMVSIFLGTRDAGHGPA